uniref:Uncharacterized protein n=1 Tax=Avena sativa TaxID=4498 RepID=A0ACD5YHH4_AVESA
MDLLEQHDVLVDILGRLPPRSLAACRRVCTAWRATVDGHRLLRAAELPLSPQGIFYETTDMIVPMLFSRPSMARHVAATFRGLGDSFLLELMDCCNGLLLLWDHVLNPATGQVAQLPPQPRPCAVDGCKNCGSDHYLAYDPAVSPHYEVFLVPFIPVHLSPDHISRHICHQPGQVSAMEWPPSPYILHVFSSSRTGGGGCWEERPFVRQGEAAGTVADVKPRDNVGFLYHTAYWRQALYVLCGHGFVLRINSHNDTYRVIKLPKGKKGTPRLGKSKNGVFCALRHQRGMFEVWSLDESHDGHQMQWALNYKIDLEPVIEYYRRNNYTNKEQWISVSLEEDPENNAKLERLLVQDIDEEWNFDDDENAIDVTGWTRKCSSTESPYYVDCFGFHPCKEIVFFYGRGRTVAYHLNCSKGSNLSNLWEDTFTPFGTSESNPEGCSASLHLAYTVLASSDLLTGTCCTICILHDSI